MKKFALVENGVVVSVFTTDKAASDFPDIQQSLIDISDTPAVNCGYLYNGSTFQAPVQPLNKTYTPVQFGGVLMTQLSSMTMSLTPSQRYQVAQALGPVALMAQVGDIAGIAGILSSIPIDGVLITQAMINMAQMQVTAYLAGQ